MAKSNELAIVLGALLLVTVGLGAGFLLTNQAQKSVVPNTTTNSQTTAQGAGASSSSYAFTILNSKTKAIAFDATIQATINGAPINGTGTNTTSGNATVSNLPGGQLIDFYFKPSGATTDFYPFKVTLRSPLNYQKTETPTAIVFADAINNGTATLATYRGTSYGTQETTNETLSSNGVGTFFLDYQPAAVSFDANYFGDQSGHFKLVCDTNSAGWQSFQVYNTDGSIAAPGALPPGLPLYDQNHTDKLAFDLGPVSAKYNLVASSYTVQNPTDDPNAPKPGTTVPAMGMLPGGIYEFKVAYKVAQVKPNSVDSNAGVRCGLYSSYLQYSSQDGKWEEQWRNVDNQAAIISPIYNYKNFN